jgi:hypothetical protein
MAIVSAFFFSGRLIVMRSTSAFNSVVIFPMSLSPDTASSRCGNRKLYWTVVGGKACLARLHAIPEVGIGNLMVNILVD